MFLTSPAFEYKRPFDRRNVDGQVWRGVEVFWDVGGFIAKVRLRDDPEGHERMLMLSRDADVVHLHNTWFALSPAVITEFAARGRALCGPVGRQPGSCLPALL